MNQIDKGDDPPYKSNTTCPLYFDDISCPLCSYRVMKPCAWCLADGGTKEHCLTVVGRCNHAFHHHCISFWLETHNHCPVDSADWNIQWYGL